MNEWLLPNLARLGLTRAIPQPNADLVTIWKTPYPVISPYKRLCAEFGWEPFAGGTLARQGDMKAGFITSGFRDELIEGRENSPHLFALAIDVAVGDVDAQMKFAVAADKMYIRIGLYPHNGFVHLDQCPPSWIARYSSTGRRYWVRDAEKKYHTFEKLEDMLLFANTERKDVD